LNRDDGLLYRWLLAVDQHEGGIMVAFDAEVLRADPAKIARGGPGDATLEATGEPNRELPACQAALASFRPALMFRYIFTTFVAVLGAMTTIGVVYCIWRILEGWNMAATLSAIGAAVTGVAAVWLGRKMVESIGVLRQALDDVSKYCGPAVTQQLK
jgi:hypothetical protein